MNYDRFDLFDAYTNQTLPHAERQALEEQLRTDNQLKADFLDYQKFKHSLDAVKLKEQLERIHNRLDRRGVLDQTDRPAQPRQHSLQTRRVRLIWPIVAVLLVAGGIYWFSRPELTEQIFVTYYQPEPVSRGEITCSPDLLPGIQHYRVGRYQEALQQFTKLPINQPCTLYYVGLAQLATDQPERAIQAFRSVLQSEQPIPTLVRQKTEWYLALAYLRDNQPTEAQRQLSGISQQADQPFRRVALRALADLKND